MVVSDEIHAPDSSRYWFTDAYEELFNAGADQRKIDKEYVREWLAAQGVLGDGEPPALTAEVKIEAASRYIQAYELITGKDFEVTDEPVGARLEAALKKAIG